MGTYASSLFVFMHIHCLNAVLACLPRLPESLQHLHLAEAPLREGEAEAPNGFAMCYYHHMHLIQEMLGDFRPECGSECGSECSGDSESTDLECPGDLAIEHSERHMLPYHSARSSP